MSTVTVVNREPFRELAGIMYSRLVKFLLVTWVPCVGVLIFAGVPYVPKLKEVVLILDPGFIM